jgi:hypothetical protein
MRAHRRHAPGHRIAVVPAGALAVPAAVVPMAGRWDADGDALRFTPRFPFSGGTSYALVRPDGAGWVEVARLRRPAAANAPIATVVAIHPTAPEVPENLLRFSVTFSASMEEGRVTGRVHLRDGDGRDIPYALLPMPRSCGTGRAVA